MGIWDLGILDSTVKVQWSIEYSIPPPPRPREKMGIWDLGTFREGVILTLWLVILTSSDWFTHRMVSKDIMLVGFVILKIVTAIFSWMRRNRQFVVNW